MDLDEPDLSLPPLEGLGITDSHLEELDAYQRRFLGLLQQSKPDDFVPFLHFINQTVTTFMPTREENLPNVHTRSKRGRDTPGQGGQDSSTPNKKFKSRKSAKSQPASDSDEIETQIDIKSENDPTEESSADVESRIFLLTDPDSPLATMDLKDVINIKTFSQLSSAEKNNLLELLLPYDRASLYYLNATLLGQHVSKAIKSYQQLLASGALKENGKHLYESGWDTDQHTLEPQLPRTQFHFLENDDTSEDT